ncbi:hypothetical protein ACFL27_17060 [candidate division CSSED10-310 bacterium]|uniref:Bulb-type lectin domain-containing protein n=1 Tax=candidate division CSSED10-310 bacterium TaxID=2855610 RepID=A0ABV6Z0C9_UNCC1
MQTNAPKISSIIMGSLYLLFSFTLSSCTNNENNEDLITFLKTYEVNGLHVAGEVLQTEDGGYIVCGSSGSYYTKVELFLLKTDQSGNEEWLKYYEKGVETYGKSIQHTSDGGYIICGFVGDFFYSPSDILLLKTDSNGNEIWSRTYDEDDQDLSYSVQQTNDGGYIICGSTENGRSDIYLLRTDAVGNKMWSRTYSGEGFDEGRSVQLTSDGAFIMCGWLEDKSGHQSNIFLLKIDDGGNELWSREYAPADHNQGYSVQQTADGGYIICGNSRFNDDDIFLMKSDNAGNEQWIRYFGGKDNDYGFYVQQTHDGGYIMCGSGDRRGWLDTEKLILIKTDVWGNVLWYRNSYLDVNWAMGSCVKQTSDGGFIVTGLFRDVENNYSLLLFKTDLSGRIGKSPL